MSTAYRLAVSVKGAETEKILGTGAAQANATFELLRLWGVQ